MQKTYMQTKDNRFDFWYAVDIADALNEAVGAKNPLEFLAQCFRLTTVSTGTAAAVDSAAPNLIEAQPQVNPDR